MKRLAELKKSKLSGTRPSSGDSGIGAEARDDDENTADGDGEKND
jgi:hypothetical protein